MGDAKSAVLAAIRGALADVPAGEQPSDVPVTREYRTSHLAGDPVDVFEDRVTDYRATVTRCTEAELPAVIGRLLAAQNVTSVVVPPGLPATWLSRFTGETVPDDPQLPPGQLDSVGGVVTTAATAIALTGTIILDGGPGQGRRALTLIPDFHLCVVRSSQIAEDVPSAVRSLDPVRPTTFVSGPSATSDIELDRVEGVHGPRHLAVIIIE